MLRVVPGNHHIEPDHGGFHPLLRLIVALGVFVGCALRACADQNVTLQNASPDLVYLPAYCGVEAADTIPVECEGIW